MNLFNLNHFLEAAIILVGFFVISKSFLWIVQKVFLRIAKKTKTKLDDRLVESTNNPISFLLVVIGLRLASERLMPVTLFIPEIQAKMFYVINNVLASVLIFISMVIIMRVSDIFVDHFGSKFVKKTKSDLDDQILGIFRKTLQVIFFILAIFYILTVWDVNVIPYLGGLGIAGIAIGLALKDSLANVFGGISIILDRNIRVGDKVKLQEGGYVGVIEDIGLRSTKMKTYDNEMIVIPNSILSNTIIHNYALPTPMNRVYVDFGVKYGSDIDKVKKAVMKALDSLDAAIKDDSYPAVEFLLMDSSSLNFKAKFWVKDYKDAYSAKLEATEKIYTALNKAKIEIPFPQMDVHLKK
ncbi:MAG: mechanosensitive ion channel family protein [Nanoarchaeota archaeon]|nr:mechanosensitive ion channel family protein [Nanoarchaeota archaeon]